MSTAPTVTHNLDAGQFELETSAGTALLRYVPRGNVRDLIHTEVPKAVEGRGHATALVKGVLDFARANDLKVIPSCPFVRAFLTKHPEYEDLRAAR